MTSAVVDNTVDPRRRHTRRRDAYDLARGVAFVLMIVAHTAPSDGPARILITSEFLTAPLFALLVGCGVELARRAQGNVDARLIAQHLVRGVLVAGLGLLLALSRARIVIVLVQLGVLIMVVPLLSWMRGRWVAVLAFAALAGSVAARTVVATHPGGVSALTE